MINSKKKVEGIEQKISYLDKVEESLADSSKNSVRAENNMVKDILIDLICVEIISTFDQICYEIIKWILTGDLDSENDIVEGFLLKSIEKLNITKDLQNFKKNIVKYINGDKSTLKDYKHNTSKQDAIILTKVNKYRIEVAHARGKEIVPPIPEDFEVVLREFKKIIESFEQFKIIFKDNDEKRI